ncbi:MAG: ATP-binding cassette domain-containing protein [Candidatus Omnitrophica bacterium]|nr:ATP-binding cassette domain-containing protein [Candidatus Omnitrophota bacterium]
MNFLELKNIRKTFNPPTNWGEPSQPVKAVDGVDLVVPAGLNIGLVGESGCGKTTLGRVAIKLIAPDAGTIIYQGEDFTLRRGKALVNFRRDIQMVFQDPYTSLDPRYNVRNLIAEGLLPAGLNIKASERDNHIQAALKDVGLSGAVLNRYPHELSGGERQRVAIARALAYRPKLLILDEAVSSLDVIIQKEIIDLLLALPKQRPMHYLFISHNLRVLRRLCQRVAVMRQGKIVEAGTTEQIFQNPAHPYTRSLIKAAIEYKAEE